MRSLSNCITHRWTSRRFTVGQVTVTNSTDNVYRQSDYESTMDALQDKLLDRLGGYLVIRYGTDGTRYLDYLKEYGNVNSQRITASTNLLDMLHTVRGEDVATAIIPLGAQLDEDKVGTVTPRLTIAAANDGKDISTMRTRWQNGAGFIRLSCIMTSRWSKTSCMQAMPI